MSALAVPVDSFAAQLEELWSIVEDVWSSLLGTSPTPLEPAGDLTEPVGAVVTLSGRWDGAVALTCPARTAEHVTRVMLGLTDDEDLDLADVQDALGEVVNVLGGNVKSLLLEGFALGLPHVVRREPPVDGELVSRSDIGWPGHVARLTIWRTTPGAAAPAGADSPQETA